MWRISDVTGDRKGPYGALSSKPHLPLTLTADVCHYINKTLSVLKVCGCLTGVRCTAESKANTDECVGFTPLLNGTMNNAHLITGWVRVGSGTKVRVLSKT